MVAQCRAGDALERPASSPEHGPSGHHSSAARKVTLCGGHKSGHTLSAALALALAAATPAVHVISADQGYGACVPSGVPRLSHRSNSTLPCSTMLVHFQRNPLETLVSGLSYHARENGEPWTSCPIVSCGSRGEPSCCDSCGCSGCASAAAEAASCERDPSGMCRERLVEIGRVARAIHSGSAAGEARSLLQAHQLTLPQIPQLSRALRAAPSYQAFLAAGVAAWHESDQRRGEQRSPLMATPPALRLAMQAEMLRYVVSELPHAVVLHEAARGSGCVVPLCLSWFMNGSTAYRDGIGLALARLGVNASAAQRVQRTMAAHDISAHPTEHSTSIQVQGGGVSAAAAATQERLVAHLRALAASLDAEMFGGWLARQARASGAYASAHACGAPPPHQPRGGGRL